MAYEWQSQAFNPVPPRRGNGFALTVDNTVRVYDLRGIAWGGKSWDEFGVGTGLYLTLHNDGTVDMYVRFQNVSTADMNSATVISAGSTIALSNAFAQRLPPGGFADVRIDVTEDLYLSAVTSSSTGTLRVHASSQPPK
jgi:hypothetical protein